MADEVNISLFSIRRCGYFDDATGQQFGDLAGAAEDLIDWLDGLGTIGESVTFDPKEDDPFLRVFCFDARPIPGRNAYLIATWNESESDEDEIQLLRMDAAIGDADVSVVTIDPTSLPGYPAYFVFLPDSGQVMNLRFEHRRNGSPAFQRYITAFLAGCSRHCVWDSKNSAKLLGYAEDGKTLGEDYEPAFEYQLVRRQGNIDWIRGQVSNIRKIKRKATVRPVIEAHRSFLDDAFIMLGLKRNNRLKADINFEYEFKTHLTLDKLNKIIEHCSNGVDEEDAWNDVGFEMAKASGKTHWISGSYAREKDVLNVPRTEGGMHDTAALAAILGDGHLERLIASALR